MKIKLLTAFLIVSLLSFNLINAMTVDFFYHPNCSHCQKVIPTIQALSSIYNSNYYTWNFYDTSKQSYNVEGVPTIRITTDDCRNIEIIGDVNILQQLPCELQEQSTEQCMTYLNGEGKRGGSWFKK